MHACASPAPAATVLRRLRERNRSIAAVCGATRSCQEMGARCQALQAQCTRQQQRADLLSKEKHEMAADLKLLQSAAHAAVSREHIELLQTQLDRAKTEASASAREASVALTREQAAAEAAKELATKVSALSEALADAHARTGQLDRAAKGHAAREESLKGENALLLRRLMDQMNVQAQAMDSEIRHHEERLAATPRGPGQQGEASRESGDPGRAERRPQ